jgi:hypothetical protein
MSLSLFHLHQLSIFAVYINIYNYIYQYGVEQPQFQIPAPGPHSLCKLGLELDTPDAKMYLPVLQYWVIQTFWCVLGHTGLQPNVLYIYVFLVFVNLCIQSMYTERFFVYVTDSPTRFFLLYKFMYSHNNKNQFSVAVYLYSPFAFFLHESAHRRDKFANRGIVLRLTNSRPAITVPSNSVNE